MKIAATMALAVLGLAGTAACSSIGHAAAAGPAGSPASVVASSAAVHSGALAHSAAPAHVATSSQTTQTSAGTSGTSTPTASPAPVQAASSQRASAKPVVFDCLNHAVAKPGTYVLTCADYGSILAHLDWQSWTSTQAVATGVHQLNDCTPNCAEGKFINYPAVVTFWRPEAVPGHSSEKYFSRITVRYTTSKRPPAYMSYGQLLNHPAAWSQVLGH